MNKTNKYQSHLFSLRRRDNFLELSNQGGVFTGQNLSLHIVLWSVCRTPVRFPGILPVSGIAFFPGQTPGWTFRLELFDQFLRFRVWLEALQEVGRICSWIGGFGFGSRLRNASNLSIKLWKYPRFSRFLFNSIAFILQASFLMRLCQGQVVLLVPDVSLLRSLVIQK